MPDQKPLKSALELAMDRLRQSDADAGIERQPLTDAQKAAIAEARNFCEAKLAEQDVLHQSSRRAVMDPAEVLALDTEYQRDRERLLSDRDAKIDSIRSGNRI